MNPCHDYLTPQDIRYEFRVMQRWCRMFGKTAHDWCELVAKKFRERHPVLPSVKARAA